jgi:hypothetical protein
MEEEVKNIPFYKKWWFWLIILLIIIGKVNKNNVNKKNDSFDVVQIDVIKMIGDGQKHFNVRDNDSQYSNLYSEWPINFSFSKDSTFEILCHLEVCGEYKITGEWKDPNEIDFYNEKEFPYDIHKKATWLNKGKLYKVPLKYNSVSKLECETNTFVGHRESKLPDELYDFLIIQYSEEDKKYKPFLFSSYIANRDFSGRGTTEVPVFEMTK